MKPIEEKNPLGVELIDHIKNSLSAHEETYVAGAWERFAGEEDKKRPIAWIWFLRGAAAVLVLGIIGLLVMLQQPVGKDVPKDSKIAQTPIKTQLPKDQLAGDSSNNMNAKEDIVISTDRGNNGVHLQPKVNSINSNTQNQQVAIENTPNLAHPKVDVQQGIANVPTVNSQSYLTQNMVPIQGAAVVSSNINADQAVKSQDNVVVPADNQAKLNEFLAAETTKNKTRKSEKSTKKKESKFTLGLVVAPSFGNVKKLNMGYGVSVDYKLSPKFSLNSGVAYNQMSAQGSGVVTSDALMMSSPASSSALFASTNEVKNLESIEERVSGIDIPLELKYHISKNFYANVGLSAFAVINQRQDNTYIVNRAVREIQQNSNLVGKQQITSVVIMERTTEKETSNVENYNYLGFYNLSFGYKKKISKENSMAIEPFVKLPLQKVNTERLNLIGAGLKVRFDF